MFVVVAVVVAAVAVVVVVVVVAVVVVLGFFFSFFLFFVVLMFFVLFSASSFPQYFINFFLKSRSPYPGAAASKMDFWLVSLPNWLEREDYMLLRFLLRMAPKDITW